MMVRNSAFVLTVLLLPPVVLAALTGLISPQVYRETAWVIPQNRGQDLVTLAAAIALAATLLYARLGAPRAIPIWVGLLGYLWYTYVGAAFSYRFNELFLVYVACFSLSSAALIALLTGFDAVALKAAFTQQAPRRAAAAFLLLMATLLAVLWLSQVVRFLQFGVLPDLIERADTPTNFVFVLDLGVIVPVSVLAAILLLRNAPWGYVLASAMLMKATTMGLALISMTAFAMRAGIAAEPGLIAFWAFLAIVGGAMTIWFTAACTAKAASPRS